MRFYENVLITRQDLSPAQSEALAQKFAEVIKENGGSVSKTEYWGLRQLAYRVKKNRKGHYHLMNITAPAAAITETERQMRLNEDILRFLTIQVDKLEEGPSVQMRRAEREESASRDREYGEERRPRDGYRQRASIPQTSDASETVEVTPDSENA